MRFTFTIEGKPQFDRAFSRVGDHIKDLRDVWPYVEREFFLIEDAQFKSEGARGGSGHWKALTSPYKEQKARTHPGAPILQRDGRLMRSLTEKGGDNVLIKEKQEFGFGTSLFYAAFHQRGTDKMEAREVISLSEDQKRDLTKSIQKGLLDIMRRDPEVTRVVFVQ